MILPDAEGVGRSVCIYGSCDWREPAELRIFPPEQREMLQRSAEKPQLPRWRDTGKSRPGGPSGTGAVLFSVCFPDYTK